MKKIFYLLLLILISAIAKSQVGNNYLNNVKTMADLATTKGSYPWQVVVVKGFYVPGDGGGGLQVWNDSATRAEIKGWNTKVTGVTTGEWERVYTAGPLNVRWFGAHGDGATDDRVIVQTVINLAPYLPLAVAQGHPIPVYMPSGKYWMTCDIGNFKTLDIPPGTELFGDGDNSIIRRKNTGGDTVGYCITLQQTLLADSTKNNYSLHDFKIVGATRGRYAVHSFGNTGAGDGGIFLILNNTKAHINRVDLYNLTVRDVSSEAIGCWSFAYLNAHNNKVINANFDAYNFVGRTTMFQNNYADSVNVAMEYRGCYSNPISGSDSTTYGLFQNNVYTNVFEYGFYLEGGNRIKITGEQLIGANNFPVSQSSQSIGIYIGAIPSSAMGIKGPVGIDVLEIENNHIDNFVETNIGTSNPQTTDGVVTNLKITGNTLSNAGGIAIQLQAADTFHFVHTIINNNLIYGWNRIQTSSSVAFSALYIEKIKNVTIENNRILNSNPQSSVYYPMFMQSTDSLVFQNNLCWGRTANLVIQHAGTNLNTFICNNIGLDPAIYPPCISATASIGQAVTSGTSGSILYVDGSILMAQDNANLFWESTHKQLGIGVNSLVDTKVAIEAHGLYNGFVGTIRAVTTDAFSINKGGSLALGGRVDGSSITTTFGAIIAAKANTTSGNGASYLSFETRSTGSSTTSEAMRIDSNQHLLIGTATSNNAFLTIAPNTTDFASIFLYGSLVNPGTLSDGMLWYNGSADALYFRHNSTTTNILAGGGGGGLTVGSTTITSGTNLRILYDNSGTLGEYTVSGSGTVVAMAASPVFTAPTLGAATATTINKVTITQPATGSTLTIVDGGSLITAGAFALTFTATATSNLTIPAGSNTAYSTLSGSITSAQLATSLTNETGTGVAVFGTAPTMSSITLIAGTATAATAPLYFTISGSVVLTSAVAGVMEPDANGILYYTHATSERGVVDAEQFIALSAAYTLTNNTSAQKIFDATTNGQVTLASSKTYFFECFFTMTNLPGSSGGVSFTLGGTATFTSIEMFSTGLRSANLANVGTAQTAFVATNTIATVSTVGTAATQVCKVTGMIRVNAGGTVIPQVTMTTASTAAIVGANSYFRITPVGTNTVTSVGAWN